MKPPKLGQPTRHAHAIQLAILKECAGGGSYEDLRTVSAKFNVYRETICRHIRALVAAGYMEQTASYNWRNYQTVAGKLTEFKKLEHGVFTNPQRFGQLAEQRVTCSRA